MKKLRLKPIEDDPVTTAGLDASPRGTAMIKLEGAKCVDYWYVTETASVARKDSRALLVPKVTRMDESTRMERVWIQREKVFRTLLRWLPSFVGYEDYTFGSTKGAGVVQISELGGALRLLLWELGYKVRTHDPKSVKLAWTGKGDASKDMMITRAEAYFDKHGFEYRKEFNKLAKLYKEGVSDALAVANLVRYEVAFRAGKIRLKNMPEHMVRVFNRVTKARPVCLIDRDWMCKDAG